MDFSEFQKICIFISSIYMPGHRHISGHEEGYNASTGSNMYGMQFISDGRNLTIQYDGQDMTIRSVKIISNHGFTHTWPTAQYRDGMYATTVTITDFSPEYLLQAVCKLYDS